MKGRPPVHVHQLGARFGRVVVVDRASAGTWRCRCDCGRHFVVCGASLAGGRGTCGRGCPLHKSLMFERTSKPQKPDQAARLILEKVRTNAKSRGRACTLTIDDVKRVRIGARCDFCSASLPPHTPCLDRIDNARGYEPDNVIPCCSLCNDARGHLLSVDEFRAAIAVRLSATGPGRAWAGFAWRSALHPREDQMAVQPNCAISLNSAPPADSQGSRSRSRGAEKFHVLAAQVPQ